jgi:hypothetical protein
VTDRNRHRRSDEIGAVPRDNEVDLVDVEELRIDPRHCRRVALVVIVNQFHRPAEQPSLGVDVLLPDLHREQRRLARGGDPASQTHAKPDRDRLRCSPGRRRQNAGDKAGRGQNVKALVADHCTFPGFLV